MTSGTITILAQQQRHLVDLCRFHGGESTAGTARDLDDGH